MVMAGNGQRDAAAMVAGDDGRLARVVMATAETTARQVARCGDFVTAGGGRVVAVVEEEAGVATVPRWRRQARLGAS